jgi:8-amino-7-oxononanoate synthase
LDRIPYELAELEAQSLLRADSGQPGEPAEMLDACSNDYLGLGRRLVSRETLEQVNRSGAGASRLVHGTSEEHRLLEADLREWLETEATLTFSSGYAANVGVIAALCDARSVIISDELNHASLIDGCRLSRSKVCVTPHGDLAAVERELSTHSGAESRWVVVESYYSMEGDTPDLQGLRALCDRYDAALVVDEAHALGVFGARGRGLCARAGMVPDVLVGTFGKALGVQGAFVASSRPVRDWLWNKARSFVFSTAMSPIVATLVRHNLALAIAAEDARGALSQMASEVRSRLQTAGVKLVGDSHGPIVPVLLGDNRRALDAAERLLESGIRVQAIRPPTVPIGQARLRVTLKADMAEQDVARLCEALIRFCA